MHKESRVSDMMAQIIYIYIFIRHDGSTDTLKTYMQTVLKKEMYIYKIVTQKDRTCKVMTKLKRLSVSSTSTLVQNDPEQSAGP